MHPVVRRPADSGYVFVAVGLDCCAMSAEGDHVVRHLRVRPDDAAGQVWHGRDPMIRADRTRPPRAKQGRRPRGGAYRYEAANRRPLRCPIWRSSFRRLISIGQHPQGTSPWFGSGSFSPEKYFLGSICPVLAPTAVVRPFRCARIARHVEHQPSPARRASTIAREASTPPRLVWCKALFCGALAHRSLLNIEMTPKPGIHKLLRRPEVEAEIGRCRFPTMAQKVVAKRDKRFRAT